MSEKKFAVLIDADNTSYNYLKAVFGEITNEGIVTYKRIYADWTSTSMQTYKEPVLQYALTPVQQYSYTTAKTATDSAMIIDAMDILHEKSVDGFCLVSSDSDFTKLATRLREGGMMVIGMGRQQTPKAFVAACNSFKYLDILTKESESVPDKIKNSTKQTEEKLKKVEELSAENQLFVETKKIIEKIIDELSDEEGWILASLIGNTVQKKLPDFDSRNFGCKKMIDLLAKMNFEIKRVTDPNNVQNPSGVLVYVKKKYNWH